MWRILFIILFYNFVLSNVNNYTSSYLNNFLKNQNLHIIDLDLDSDNVNNNLEDRRNKYGHRFDVNFNLNNSGSWTVLDNGELIWTLGIRSPNAYALKLQFNEIYLPNSSELVIYNDEMDMFYGPYTSNNDFNNNTYGTPLIKGDLIILELHISSFVHKPKLSINSVIHDYSDVLNFHSFDRDRNCGYNVACDSAQEYRDQANSVIYMIINEYTCTGTLINNANNDNTPYVLTAWHCIVGETNIGDHNDFIYYFNHEATSCEGNNGSFEYSVSGSTLLATRNENVGSDFALLVLDEMPPTQWDPYYAGWSNDESAPLISVGIHHPEDDPRKINFDDDYAYSCAWNTADTHWCLNWDDGGTASGSSGSALFNNEKQLIGTNTGSDGPDCSPGPDLYGKFSLSWDGGNNSTRRLKDWLDPDNTGIVSIDGIYTNSNLLGDINLDELVNIQDVIIVINIIVGLNEYNSLADLNYDNIIDVLDIVLLVNIILDSI